MKSPFVYIREADANDLPEDVVQGRDKLFALHDAQSGEQLAIAEGRKLAFALARKNDMTPISVH
ncbi:MAG: DUF1150 family protein [Pseudomonadota bacterium]